MEESQSTSFAYYLMSNASMNVYPDNKPQQFRTLLPKPLDLVGEWEVGLSSIIYPHNWNNLKANSFLEVVTPYYFAGTPEVHSLDLRVYFNYQQFATLDQCIKLLNETVNLQLDTYFREHLQSHTKFQRAGQFAYSNLEFELTTTLPTKLRLKEYGYPPTQFKIRLPLKNAKERELWRLLGVDDSETELTQGKEGQHAASLTLHFPALFIYTPMIDYVGVGDTNAPLLSVVPVRGSIGDLVYERFDRPLYVRVNQKHLSEIELSIKDDTGENVQFRAGKTILILHFRRRT